MSVLRLLAFVLPLGLDDFAVAAALGATGMLSARDRLRVAVLFVVFEVGMPLIGLAAGAPLARAVGGVADYLATGALAGLGLWMLVSGRGGQGGEERAARLGAARGFALLGLGLGISLDELAIGFSLGLARLPVRAVIVAIAVQAFLAAQLGLLLGARIGERIREGAERVAGAALLALAAYLLAEHLAGH
jgi:manganese efflux pump family protein